MYYNINTFLLFALLFTICIACSDSDIIDTDHQSALAVNAQLFQGDSLMHMVVSQTIGIGDTLYYNDDLELKNIELYLDTPDQGTIQALSNSNSMQYNGVSIPIWRFDYKKFIPESEYMLRAEKDGFESVIASTVVPSKPTILGLEYTPSSSIESVVRDRFELTISDPTDQENYYYIRALETVDDSGFNFQNDYRFYNAPINPIDEGFLEELITSFSDQDFSGREHKVVVYGERIKRTQISITFLLYQISKEHYDFIQNFERLNTDSPISEPVIFNTNVIGGHGIFAITSIPDTLNI